MRDSISFPDRRTFNKFREPCNPHPHRWGLPPLLDQAGAKPEAPESKAAGSDGWLACHETQA